MDKEKNKYMINKSMTEVLEEFDKFYEAKTMKDDGADPFLTPKSFEEVLEEVQKIKDSIPDLFAPLKENFSPPKGAGKMAVRNTTTTSPGDYGWTTVYPRPTVPYGYPDDTYGGHIYQYPPNPGYDTMSLEQLLMCTRDILATMNSRSTIADERYQEMLEISSIFSIVFTGLMMESLAADAISLSEAFTSDKFFQKITEGIKLRGPFARCSSLYEVFSVFHLLWNAYVAMENPDGE